MKLADLVLIDTCMWIPFFNRPPSRTKRAIDELLEEDRAALIGPILTEVLSGFRRDAQADWVSSALRGVHYLDLAWDDCRSAAKRVNISLSLKPNSSFCVTTRRDK